MARQGHYEWSGDVAEWVWDDEAPEAAPDYASQTKATLAKLAKDRDIEGADKMTKAELIEALSA